MIVFLAAVSVALVVSFLCSIFESVLLSLGHADVEALEREGRPAGRILKDFKSNIDVPIAAILIANTVAHTIGASVAGASYGSVFDEDTLWIFTIIFTIAVLLFTEIIPKTLGVSKARSFATPVAYGIKWLTLILGPIVFLSELISRSLRRGQTPPVTSTEEIRLLASLGGSEGAVGRRTARMIVGATQLADLTAKNVMMPRRLITFLSGTQSREAILKTVIQSHHSRFPFSATGEFDDVSGIVLAKELLIQLHENVGADINWETLIRKPLTIPATKPLNKLLLAFQESRSHMALVVDEYGGVEGIVTLEDVLEEIVGDINDESDRPEETPKQQPDGSTHVSGRHELRKIFHELEIDPNLHANTVGGLVFQLLGRLPLEGDEVEWEGFSFQVISVNSRGANQIAITPPSEPTTKPE